MGANHVDRAVDRITLADTSQVDPHAFAVEGDRVAVGIESKVMPARPGTSIGQRRLVRARVWARARTPTPRKGLPPSRRRHRRFPG